MGRTCYTDGLDNFPVQNNNEGVGEQMPVE